MPTFNQTAFSQPAVHFQQTQPTQTNQTGQQYPNNVQSQQFQQFQTATISANNAKFPYLEKEKYEIWAMKMEYEIQNADHNLEDVFMQRNSQRGENLVASRLYLKNISRSFTIMICKGIFGWQDSEVLESQLNQVQARPDNDDINLKFLRALPSSWSQVALALEIRAAAPTHSAFIGAANSGSKLTYSDQQSFVPSVYQTSGRSDNIMECVMHSFVAENEPDQDMIYEDFDQVDQLEMEELDLKWQMAILSLRINRFEKKAGRKMNYNNKQPARFDRRKVRCYKCLQLGHFARECNVKTVDDKARYSAFKVTEVKTDEPKALVSVDSMVNWSDHAAENKTGEVEKVYGMMAVLHADNGGAGVSDAAAEFAMIGFSPKVQNCPLGCDSKINDLNNMYNNLDRLYNDCYIKVQAYQNVVKTLESQKDWYHKTQIALEEKIRVLSANLENTTNTLSYTEKLHDQAQKEKKDWEVKYEATLAKIMKVSPSITGTYMPTPIQSDIEETQVVPNSSASVTAGGSDPAASRNRPAVNSAGRPNPTGRVGQAAHTCARSSIQPAGWSKRPALVSAVHLKLLGVKYLILNTSDIWEILRVKADEGSFIQAMVLVFMERNRDYARKSFAKRQRPNNEAKGRSYAR
ncbi:ribonuclease H-like domain-containing protein [Tanacetum coccineum]